MPDMWSFFSRILSTASRRGAVLFPLLLFWKQYLLVVSNNPAVIAKRVADTTYYDLLEVPTDAEEGQLKKAYRKLALKHHPDKLPKDATEEDKKAAESKFAEISVAYDTLSNPEKRRFYDQVGVEGVKQGGDGGGGGRRWRVFV